MIGQMNKKGDVDTTQKLIVGIIVFILLMVFAGKVASYFSSAGKIGVCQASILKANVLKEASFNTIVSSLSCNNLPDLTIKSNVIENRKINDDAVKKQIADKMIECWKMTGRGGIDPYKKYEDDQTYCLLCADVIFDKDFVEQAKDENYQLKDIAYWLATNNAGGTKTTYFEALFDKQPNTAAVSAMKGQETSFDIEKQYSVVWRIDTAKPGALTLAGIGLGTGAGAVGGAKLGAVIGSFIPGVGTLAGTAVGTLGGAAVGLIGSYYISENLNPQNILMTGVYLVPKSKLGEDLTVQIEGKTITKPKPFCTKLVNY